MSLGNILARLAELAEQLRKAQGRNRSRSGPPVVFLQRVPKEGARS